MKCYPNMYQQKIENINYQKLKKLGIKCLIFDLDNTIALINQDKITDSTKKLLNSLKKDLNLATGEISKALGRGRHTTRHVELLEVAGGLVADTPGFSSLNFNGMDKKDIKDNFKEFYENEDKCKYKDCMHLKEDGCYIKELVENGKIRKTRYENYKKFIESIEELKR